jgi:hypothetical protein
MTQSRKALLTKVDLKKERENKVFENELLIFSKKDLEQMEISKSKVITSKTDKTKFYDQIARSCRVRKYDFIFDKSSDLTMLLCHTI